MPESDLALLTGAAREAGAIARRYFNANCRVWHKPDNAGPVTEADLAVNGHLRATLCAARPDYGWLSEETEDDPSRLGAERVFIIDPIDGTRAFIEGGRDWSHSLAVADRGEIVAAVVYLPLHDHLYSAAKGGGATCDGAAMHATDTVDLAEADILAAGWNMADRHWRAGPPPVRRHFRSSLAYRLCLVASGRFDAMLSLRPVWEWDIAAGALIVTEARGHATDRAGRPLRFNNAHPQLDGLVAGGALHGPLLDQLA